MPNYTPVSQKPNQQRFIQNMHKSHGDYGKLAPYAISCSFEVDVYKIVKPMEKRQAFVRIAVRDFLGREDLEEQLQSIRGASRKSSTKRQDDGDVPLSDKQIGITFDIDVDRALKQLRGKKQGVIRKAVRTRCVQVGLLKK